MWEYRELLYFLIWRDIKVRYKQTIGCSLGHHPTANDDGGQLARMPSDGISYPIFSFAAWVHRVSSALS
jgi:lipopolysaccharide transport system permease protein